MLVPNAIDTEIRTLAVIRGTFERAVDIVISRAVFGGCESRSYNDMRAIFSKSTRHGFDAFVIIGICIQIVITFYRTSTSCFNNFIKI